MLPYDVVDFRRKSLRFQSQTSVNGRGDHAQSLDCADLHQRGFRPCSRMISKSVSSESGELGVLFDFRCRLL
jgi:hypothetical protein